METFRRYNSRRLSLCKIERELFKYPSLDSFDLFLAFSAGRHFLYSIRYAFIE